MAELSMRLQAGILLLVHGEVTSPEVDMFDREAVFIQTVLEPLLAQVPGLRVVLEHITTEQAVNFVRSAPDNVAATVTPQHMLYNRNALFQVGCLGCNSDLQSYDGSCSEALTLLAHGRAACSLTPSACPS